MHSIICSSAIRSFLPSCILAPGRLGVISVPGFWHRAASSRRTAFSILGLCPLLTKVPTRHRFRVRGICWRLKPFFTPCCLESAPFAQLRSHAGHSSVTTHMCRKISVRRATREGISCQRSSSFSGARLTMQRSLANARLPSPAAVATAPFIVATAKPPHYRLGL